jgi:hypothetical protein
LRGRCWRKIAVERRQIEEMKTEMGERLRGREGLRGRESFLIVINYLIIYLIMLLF